jgi:hydroxymethylpyrimidine pyrophosphatase-like HAD family hydrolase
MDSQQYAVLARLSRRTEYLHSHLLAKLQRLAAADRPWWIAFFDVDGTYLHQQHVPLPGEGDSELARAENARYEAMTWKLARLLHARDIPIVLVTGRDLISSHRIQPPPAEELRLFDAAATSVGTELWVQQQDNRYIRDSVYNTYIAHTTGFDRAAVYAVCRTLQHWYSAHEPARNVLFQSRDTENNVAYHEGADTLTGEPPGKPPLAYKISLFCEGTDAEAAAVVARFRVALTAAGFGGVRLVLSHSRALDGDVHRFNLDILAHAKGDAVQYMTQEYCCRGIVAGDSGNDADMLLDAADAGVVVGGSKPEIAHLLAAQNTLRATRHFRLLARPHGVRLLYVDPCGRRGPESLLHAWRSLALLDTLAAGASPRRKPR